MANAQSPINSGLNAATTTTEALAGRDLTGKTIIVTGGYSGIGLETTRVLKNAGATVVVPVRTPEKARQNLQGLEVEMYPLDLLDPASIDAFAAEFLCHHDVLDILINSAGVMMLPDLERDNRGYEVQFSANHLGHYQLTARLWPALKAANGARVISVSSRGHRIAGVDFDDPNYQHRAYEKRNAYGQSKTANALFAVGLDARGMAHGVRAFSLHPGAIPTELSRHLTDEDLSAWKLTRNPDGSYTAGDPSLFKTVPQGAATSVWCATSPLLVGKGGVYCEDCDIASPAVEGNMSRGVAAYATDPEAAERLWVLSERLTGVRM